MGAFIETVNDWGTQLIDDTYRNTSLRTKGSATAVPMPAGGGFIYELYYTTPAGQEDVWPMCAIYCPNGYAQVKYASKDGAAYHWTVVFQKQDFAPSFEYFIFQMPAVLAGTGLVVLKDEQGRVTFDSDEGYLIVREVFSTPQNTPGVSREYGRKTAFIFSRPGYFNNGVVEYTGEGPHGPRWIFYDDRTITAVKTSPTGSCHIRDWGWSGRVFAGEGKAPQGGNYTGGDPIFMAVDVSTL